MAQYYIELLKKAENSLAKNSPSKKVRGRGRPAEAHIRRAISDTYYALFHFVLLEIGEKIVGSGSNLRLRRQIFIRNIAHFQIKEAANKLRKTFKSPDDDNLMKFLDANFTEKSLTLPSFVLDLMFAIIDAQKKRHDADYNLSQKLTLKDARVLLKQVKISIDAWKNANDKNLKHAICLFFLLGGKLRAE